PLIPPARSSLVPYTTLFRSWQYTSKVPLAAEQELTWKDLGILAVKIRCHDIQKTYAHLKSVGAVMLGEPVKNPIGVWHFYVKDPDRKSTRLNSSHVKISYAV